MYELVNAADSVVSARTIELNDDAAANIEMLQLRPSSNRRETRERFDDDRLLKPQHQKNIRGAKKRRSTETKNKTPEKTPEANPKSEP